MCKLFNLFLHPAVTFLINKLNFIILLSSICITTTSQIVTIDSTNLPLIIVNTNGENIIDEPKINAQMEIKHKGNGLYNYPNDSANIYSGLVGIEIRGTSSAEYPQKPYGLETRDTLGDNRNVTLFDMPSENDWILLANYNDKTFLRNTLAFHLSNKMGHYSPRAKFCELIINDDYKGIYIFTEKIKRDENRVNIASLNPNENSGNDLTGGYIFKVDYPWGNNYWTSNYSPINASNERIRYVYEYPKDDDITSVQETYLKEYINVYENTLYGANFIDAEIGYRAFLHVDSFIDYMLVNELSRNGDGFKKSRCFYKDKDSNGSLIKSGPVWDFDWAWKNVDECYIFHADDGSGWAHEVNACHPDIYSPSWITRIKQDTSFVNQYNNRYNQLRANIFSREYLFEYIDSVYNLLNEAQFRHYEKWPILGINVGTPEDDFQPETYLGEIEKIKAWIEKRLNWLDNNALEETQITPAQFTTINTLESLAVNVFPNPASNTLNIESKSEIAAVELYNYSGTLLRTIQINSYSTSMNLSPSWKGLILVRIILSNGKFELRKILKK